MPFHGFTITRLFDSRTGRSNSNLQLARAVAQAVTPHAEFLCHRKQQIRHWRVRRELEMAAAFQLARGPARQDDGQRVVIVLVPLLMLLP
jgi:hypothetical protein